MSYAVGVTSGRFYPLSQLQWQPSLTGHGNGTAYPINLNDSTQSISLPTIASTVIVRVPSLAYAVVGATISSGAALNVPSLTYQVLMPSIASGAVLNPPSTIYAVAMPTLASGAAVNQPGILPPAQSITTATISSGATVAAPTADYRVTMSTIASGAAVNAPATTYTIALPTIASGAIVRVPTVAYSITVPSIASTAIVNVPALAGVVNLPTIASGASVLAPSATYTVNLPMIAAGSTVNVPALAYSIQMPTQSSGAVVFPATLAAVVTMPSLAAGSTAGQPALAYGVAGAFISQTATVNPATLSGANTVTMAFVASGVSFGIPALAMQIDLPHLVSSNSLGSPGLSYAVDGATIPAGSQAFAAVVAVSGSLAMATIGSAVQLFAATLRYEIELPVVASIAGPFAPGLSYGLLGATIPSGVRIFGAKVANYVLAIQYSSRKSFRRNTQVDTETVSIGASTTKQTVNSAPQKSTQIAGKTNNQRRSVGTKKNPRDIEL